MGPDKGREGGAWMGRGGGGLTVLWKRKPLGGLQGNALSSEESRHPRARRALSEKGSAVGVLSMGALGRGCLGPIGTRVLGQGRPWVPGGGERQRETSDPALQLFHE